MGKLITLLAILIFIDMLFIITGQLVLDSPSSVIISAVTDPSSLKDSNFWAILVTGLGGLAVVGAVIAGIATRSSDILVFVLMATSLSLLIGDYVSIFNHLYALNNVMATIILVPVIVIFALVIIEWLRGKD